jgi:hypothetical protein
MVVVVYSDVQCAYKCFDLPIFEFRHKMVLYLDGSYLGGHLWTR